MTRVLLTVVVFLASVSFSYGYSRLRREIPNGYNVKHPCPGQPIWSAVGHFSPDYSPRKNAFGNTMKANSLQWESVCRLDSDGDGFTNGAELGDPFCKWKPGDPSPGEVLGHPGFCEPSRAKCDSGITHPECPNQRANAAGRRGSRPRQTPRGSQDHPQTDWRKQIMGESRGPPRSIPNGPRMPVRRQDVFGQQQSPVRPAPRFQRQPDNRLASQSQGGQILQSQQNFGRIDGDIIGRMSKSSNFQRSPDFGTFGSNQRQRFFQAGSSRMGSSGQNFDTSPGSSIDTHVPDRIPRERIRFSGSMGTDMGMTSSDTMGNSQVGVFPDFMTGPQDSGLRPFPNF